MEFLQAFITLTVFGGGFFYLINRIHHLDKSFNAIEVQTTTLQSILLSIKELNGGEKIAEKESTMIETVAPIALTTKKPRKENRNQLTDENKYLDSKQKQTSRKTKLADEPHKNQAEKIESLSDLRKRPRTEEQKRIMSERRKAWWEKKRMEKAKLELSSDPHLEPAMREVSMV